MPRLEFVHDRAELRAVIADRDLDVGDVVWYEGENQEDVQKYVVELDDSGAKVLKAVYNSNNGMGNGMGYGMGNNASSVASNADFDEKAWSNNEKSMEGGRRKRKHSKKRSKHRKSRKHHSRKHRSHKRKSRKHRKSHKRRH